MEESKEINREKSSSVVMTCKKRKLQSAIDFLSTYSLAFLIIAILLAILFIFVGIPKSTIPPQCTAYSGFTCVDAVYSINQSTIINGTSMKGSRLFINIIDSSPGTVNISSFDAAIGGVKGIGGCKPSTLTNGNTAICWANFSVTPALNNIYTGTYNISANYCPPSSSTCAASSTFTYGGAVTVLAGTNQTVSITTMKFTTITSTSSTSTTSTSTTSTTSTTTTIAGTPILWCTGGVQNSQIIAEGYKSRHLNKNISFSSLITSSNNITIVQPPISFLIGYSNYYTYIGQIYKNINNYTILNWTQEPISFMPQDSCATSNNYIYCIGGGQNPNAYGNSYLQSSGSFSAKLGLNLLWKEQTSYPTPIAAPSCAIYNNYIYCVGGYRGIYLPDTSPVTTPWDIIFAPNGKNAYIGTTIGTYSLNISSIKLNSLSSPIVNNLPQFQNSSNIGPTPIAFSNSSAYGYFINAFGNNVSVFNTSNNIIIKKIHLPKGASSGEFGPARSIAISPSGSYAYIGNYNNTLSVLNTSTGNIIDTITGFNITPYSITLDNIAIAPNGEYAYVAGTNVTGGSGIIYIINTSTNKITTIISKIRQSINLPFGFVHVAISPSGAYAYITSADSTIMLILNTSTNEITGEITGVYYPQWVAFAPNGAYAYVSDNPTANGPEISIVNTSTNTVTGIITPMKMISYPTGAGSGSLNNLNVSLVYSAPVDNGTIGNWTQQTNYPINIFDSNCFASGGYLYCVGGAITKYNLSDNTYDIVGYNNSDSVYSALISNGLVGSWSKQNNNYPAIISSPDFPSPVDIAIAPSGAYAYVTNKVYGNNTVSIANISTGTITGTITGFFEPSGVAIAPSGAYAYVINTGNDIISIVNTSTNTITGTITGFVSPYAVAIAPSGAYAYVTNEANVSIVNTSTNTITGTITGFFEPSGVAIAPSGAYAYVINGFNNTVSIVNTSTKTITGTITGYFALSGIAFAPNGAYAYTSSQIINTTSHTVAPIFYYNSSQPSAQQGFSEGLSCAVNNTDSSVYCMGLGGNIYSTTFNNGTINPWEQQNHYPLLVNSSSCVSYKNHIYCVGGFESSIYGFYYTGFTTQFTSNAKDGVLGNWAGNQSSYPAAASELSCVSNQTISGPSPTFTTTTSTTISTSITTSIIQTHASLSLNVYPPEAGSVSPSGTNIYPLYTTVNVTTTNNSGWFFNGWNTTNVPCDENGNPNPEYNPEGYSSCTAWENGSELFPFAGGSGVYYYVFGNSPDGRNLTITLFSNASLTATYFSTTTSTTTTSTIAPSTITTTISTAPPPSVYTYVTDPWSNQTVIVNIFTKQIIGVINNFDYPSGVAFAPSGAYAYIVNFFEPSYGNREISIVDTSTSAITGSISDGFVGPTNVAIAPSGAYAYVTDYSNNTVDVISTSTGKVIDIIKSSSFNSPDGVAFAPSGAYAYVTNFQPTGAIDIINTSTNSVIGSISGTFDYPSGISFTQNGNFAYVTVGGINSVDVISTSTRQVIDTISGFDGPTDVAIGPNGNAYVTDYYNNSISIVNISRNTIVGIIKGFSYPDGIAIS